MQFRRLTLLGLSSVLWVLANPAIATLNVNEFTTEQIAGKGCGMTLWKLSRKASNRYVFSNGLEPNSMEMKLNGQVRQFTRIKGSGPEFYGQMTSQTFQDKDKTIIVEVYVELGQRISDETVEISKGTIRVKQGRDVVSFAVRGDAGC